MEVIILAAGKSKRYYSQRPKYTLSDYRGVMMLEDVIKKYNLKNNVTVILNKSNEKNFPVKNYINSIFKKKINWVFLKKFTNGPAETAYIGINSLIKKKKKDFQILIRDCDAFFSHKNLIGNYVVSSSILDYVKSQKGDLKNKSYLKINKFGSIIQLVEKKIISKNFSVGGYKFQSAKKFCKFFSELNKMNTAKEELFISHVIERAILKGEIFKSVKAENFIDLGTINEWHDYNNKPVIFCDIDGTIIKAQLKGNYKNKIIPLEKNVKFVKRLQKKGAQLIFTTARDNKYRNTTEIKLKKIGFKNFQIIFGLYNSSRILINDYNDLNPYPRAVAINIKRDSDNLQDFKKLIK